MPRHYTPPQPNVSLTCPHCGTSFIVNAAQAHRRTYCSWACAHAHWPDDATRFWAKVNKDGPIPMHHPGLDPCWLWTAATMHGYGAFVLRHHGRQQAHRLAWTWTNGPIPNGLSVLHHCDNPTCVRPSHLFLGTARDNAWDMMHKHRKVTKLTAEHVQAIRAHTPWRYGDIVRLAREYGVSLTTIQNVKRGRKWRHLDDPTPSCIVD